MTRLDSHRPVFQTEAPSMFVDRTALSKYTVQGDHVDRAYPSQTLSPPLLTCTLCNPLASLVAPESYNS